MHHVKFCLEQEDQSLRFRFGFPMKVFKKRKPLKDNTQKRIPFEHIIHEVFIKYKDNVICSQDTRMEIIKDISKMIREQLPKS
jgi:hypothetical protein